MDYVLDALQVCPEFTLMEAVNYVAFGLPPVNKTMNIYRGIYCSLFPIELNMFERPRTYWPDHVLDNPAIPYASKIPRYPFYPEMDSHFYIRTTTEKGKVIVTERGTFVQEITKENEDDIKKIEAYRIENKDIIDAYYDQKREHDLQFQRCIDEAQQTLFKKLTEGTLRAKGTTLIPEGEKSESELTFKKITEGAYSENFEGSRAVFTDRLFETEYDIKSAVYIDRGANYIPKDHWFLMGVDWSTCSLEFEETKYTGIHFDKKDLLHIFPVKSTELKGKLSCGISFLDGTLLENIKRKPSREGEVKKYNGDWKAEFISKIYIAQNNTIESATAELIEECAKVGEEITLEAARYLVRKHKPDLKD